jgi:hypothetical protein
MAYMTRGFESTPIGPSELAPAYSRLFQEIGSRFYYAETERGLRSPFVYLEIEDASLRFEDGRTEVVKLASVLLAESFDHHARHMGELLRLSIPIADEDDIVGAVSSLELDNQYDRTNKTRLRVITTHTKPGKEVAFKITGSGITPAQKPRFGTHSRFAGKSFVEAYLAQTNRKVKDWPMLPLKLRSGSND